MPENPHQDPRPYNYESFYRDVVKGDLGWKGGPRPGSVAPPIDLPTVDGGRFRLADCRGREPVLVQFGSLT